MHEHVNKTNVANKLPIQNKKNAIYETFFFSIFPEQNLS